MAHTSSVLCGVLVMIAVQSEPDSSNRSHRCFGSEASSGSLVTRRASSARIKIGQPHGDKGRRLTAGRALVSTARSRHREARASYAGCRRLRSTVQRPSEHGPAAPTPHVDGRRSYFQANSPLADAKNVVEPWTGIQPPPQDRPSSVRVQNRGSLQELEHFRTSVHRAERFHQPQTVRRSAVTRQFSAIQQKTRHHRNNARNTMGSLQSRHSINQPYGRRSISEPTLSACSNIGSFARYRRAN